MCVDKLGKQPQKWMLKIDQNGEKEKGKGERKLTFHFNYNKLITTNS